MALVDQHAEMHAKSNAMQLAQYLACHNVQDAMIHVGTLHAEMTVEKSVALLVPDHVLEIILHH